MTGEQNGRKMVRRGLIWAFWLGILGTIGYGWYYLERHIPDRLSVVEQEREDVNLELPFGVTLYSESEEVLLGNRSEIPSGEIRLRVAEPFSVYGADQGSFRVGVELFGKIRFKEIQVDVVDTQYAVPCGTPVGIYLKSRGVMVIGTGRVTDARGQEMEPAYGVLQSGDYIEAINGEPLEDKEALITSLNRIGESEALLRVRRNGSRMDVRMNPVKTEDGSYKLGAWVRDDTQGIGTMTYVDLNGNFGALGHGISDSDTGEVVEIGEGALYETEILGIEKGTIGKPGVMAGVIYYGPGTRLGTVEENTQIGIFGKINETMRKKLPGEPVEVGYKQDVHRGQAWIRSNVSGQVQDYEIEILKADLNPVQENKSLVIRVVDEDLLRLTGGIVQGMSGSPILQDGKLVGAVTHVFVQDSARGYGIFAEDMIRR